MSRPAADSCSVGLSPAVLLPLLLPLLLLLLPQARRALSAMSAAEQKINARLLREVEAAAAAGTIPAIRSC